MKTHPLLLRAGLPALLLLLHLSGPCLAQTPPPPAAAQPDTAQLLREALFDEQGLRDPDKAAAGYENVIAAYDAQRAFAATALYRLAEVRRAQNKKDQAVLLYQRLLTEFPTHDPLARLSRENLTALGVKEIPGATPALTDEQDVRIAELKRMMKDSPDIVLGSNADQPLWTAASTGQTKVVEYLLNAGAPSSDRILEIAAGNGHLKVCEALIARGADINNSGALMQVVYNGRMEVLRLCIEKGANLNTWPVLNKAVNLRRTEMLRLLLEKGADPNLLHGSDTDSALFNAVAYGTTESAELLIQAKANPNLPPPANSPLYLAVRNGNVPMAARLIGIEADPEVRCVDSTMPEFQIPSDSTSIAPRAFDPTKSKNDFKTTLAPKGWTLLHAAVMSGSVEMLDLVLTTTKNTRDMGDSGKQTALCLAVGLQSEPMTERLLKAGADPKVMANNGLPLLFTAADSKNERLVKLLLEAGADATETLPDGRTAVSMLIHSNEKALPLIRLLIAAGADPDKRREQTVDAPKGPMGVHLAREFRYPKTTTADEIILSLPESGLFLSLAKKNFSGPQTPPSLADLLLEARFRWLNIYAPDWTRLHLHRRDAQGKLQERIIDDWSEGNPPDLQWGDIVEFVSANWQVPSDSISSGYVEKLPANIQARLRSALVRHVTVKMDGKSYPMTLRGGLKVYNPLKPEAPLTDAASLMKMMGAADLRWFNASVRIKRLPEQGGGEISSGLRSTTEIPLKEGDILELEGPPAALVPVGNTVQIQSGPGFSSVSQVMLLTPGLPFSKSIPCSGDEVPSLIQFLAAVHSVPDAQTLTKWIMAEKSGSLSKLTGKAPPEAWDGLELQLVLPRPDWSQVRIRRLVGNDEYKEIPVDLAAAISACTDATTPDEARKYDIALKPGDAVLLPVRPETAGESAWSGWDPETIRFFSKVLNIQVNLSEPDGSFRAIDLEYMPVRYLETAAGLLGLPAGEPAPSRINAFTVESILAGLAPGKNLGWIQRAGASERTTLQAESASGIRTPNSLRTGDRIWLHEKDTLGLGDGTNGQPVRRRAVPPPPQRIP
ncbi:MAG: hypothetical protein JWL81_3217 [Verrucomicrobiales bacterium]|nr:hypothetical protein [Verrucomicrobiales bacterium]